MAKATPTSAFKRFEVDDLGGERPQQLRPRRAPDHARGDHGQCQWQVPNSPGHSQGVLTLRCLQLMSHQNGQQRDEPSSLGDDRNGDDMEPPSEQPTTKVGSPPRKGCRERKYDTCHEGELSERS